MRYQGGKNRIGKKIAEVLTAARQSEQPYWEPFVGACGVLIHMEDERVGTDSRREIIEMWECVQEGWVPPEEITRAQWEEAKFGHGSDEMRGFVGAGCSYGGRWFCSYGVDNRPGRNFVREARNGVLKKAPLLKGVTFGWRSYDEYRSKMVDANWLIYCDPPYANTGGYPGLPQFNHEEFWEIMREWSQSNLVFISEYQAPSDFECVWFAEVPADMQGRHSKGKKRKKNTERLFQWMGR